MFLAFGKLDLQRSTNDVRTNLVRVFRWPSEHANDAFVFTITPKSIFQTTFTVVFVRNVAENIVLPPTLRRRNGARSGRPGNRRLIIIVYSLCEDAHAKYAEFRRRRNSSIRSNFFFTLKLLFLTYTQEGGGGVSSDNVAYAAKHVFG